MKDLNVYKKLILQRSALKQKRKKAVRTAAIACCIPLSICIVAVCAWSSSSFSVSKDAAPEADQLTGSASYSDGNTSGSGTQLHTVYVRWGSNEPVPVTNQVAACQLTDLIENAFNVPECAPETFTDYSTPTEAEPGDTKFEDGSDNFTDRASIHYTIQITDPYANETSYLLEENRLTNTLTGQSVMLDLEQQNALIEALNGLF